MSVMNCMQVL
uniref:Uncharacterized protein n=1 Tax=Lepeophtheirus salmonis TaxID=72036 RepID=A0A0K2TH86_LEPSM